MNKRIFSFCLLISIFTSCSTSADAQIPYPINDTSTARTAINTYVYPNNVKAVTPGQLHDILIGLVNSMGSSVTSLRQKADTLSGGTATWALLKKKIDSLGFLIPVLTGYLPYTGATTNVNINSRWLQSSSGGINMSLAPIGLSYTNGTNTGYFGHTSIAFSDATLSDGKQFIYDYLGYGYSVTGRIVRLKFRNPSVANATVNIPVPTVNNGEITLVDSTIIVPKTGGTFSGDVTFSQAIKQGSDTVFQKGTGTFSSLSGTLGSGSTFTWIKIGNTVFVNGDINGIGSSGMAGNGSAAFISGLPFNASTTAYKAGAVVACLVQGTPWAGYTSLNLIVDPGTKKFIVQEPVNNDPETYNNVSQGRWHVSFHYVTDF